MVSIAHSASKVDNPASIKLGESFNFHNKDNTAPTKYYYSKKYKKYGDWNDYARGAFDTVDRTPAQIATHTLEGHAISVAAHSGNWRHKNYFVSSQLIGVDFDEGVSVAQLDADPLAAYAFLIYATPSSTHEKPKSRPFFILDQPITDPEQYTKYAKRLARYFGQTGAEADKACKDTSRYFNGSANAEHRLKLDAVLPIAILEALPPHPDELKEVERARIKAERKANPTPRNASYEVKYANKGIELELDKLASTAKGGRHIQNIDTAIAIGSFIPLGLITYSDAFNRIVDAAVSAGRDRTEAEQDTRDGIEYGMQNPRDIPPPKPTASGKRSKRSVQARERKESAPAKLADQIRPFSLNTLTVDRAIEARYISEIDPRSLPQTGALLVVSAIGTGKTELIKRMIADFEKQHGYTPSVCVIIHRQGLARDIARRLEIECYKDYGGDTAQFLRSAQQLAICYNSLFRLVTQGAPLPKYDLVIIDEIEQFHNHLDGDTFKKGEAQLAYEVGRQLVKGSGMVIGLDAHATHISQTWLKELKGQVYTLANTYQRQHNRMVIHADKNEAIQTACNLIEAGERVVIPCGSRRDAQTIHSLLSARFGKDAGYLVCSENSEGHEAQTFIKEINTRISSLRYLVHTTSLGTGVDITAAVRAVVGIFGRNLPATDIMQMLGRCRNTQETHVYVSNCEGHEEEDANIIYARHEQNALKTAGQCEFNDYGVLSVTPIQQAILRLLSMLEAGRNQSKNNLLGHLTALAKAANYPLEFCEGKAGREFADQLKQAAADLADAQKDAVLNAIPVSHEELDTHRDKGTLTDEIRAGHELFKIMDTVGLDHITPVIYDDLHTPTKRAQLITFTDLQTPTDELKERDRQEAHNGHLLNKRKHHLMRRTLVHQAISDVFGERGLDFEGDISGQDIAARLENFLTLHRDNLRTYFNRRDDKSGEAVPILRWLLDKAGVKLRSHQVMQDGQRFMMYCLDHEHIATWQGYAAARRAHLAKKPASKKPLLKSGIDSIVPNVSVQPKSAAPPSSYDDLEAQARFDAAWGVAASAGIVKG